jgi:hypothetical protein
MLLQFLAWGLGAAVASRESHSLSPRCLARFPTRRVLAAGTRPNRPAHPPSHL